MKVGASRDYGDFSRDLGSKEKFSLPKALKKQNKKRKKLFFSKKIIINILGNTTVPVVKFSPAALETRVHGGEAGHWRPYQEEYTCTGAPIHVVRGD